MATKFDAKNRESEIQIMNSWNFVLADDIVKNLQGKNELHGITFGDIDLIDLIAGVCNVFEVKGVDLATWSASGKDLTKFEFLIKDYKLDYRFLFDFSFKARYPNLVDSVKKELGDNSVRFLTFHAKFVLFELKNGENLILITSMNLNKNKRMENYYFLKNSSVYDMYKKVVDDLFTQTILQNNNLKNVASFEDLI